MGAGNLSLQTQSLERGPSGNFPLSLGFCSAGTRPSWENPVLDFPQALWAIRYPNLTKPLCAPQPLPLKLPEWGGLVREGQLASVRPGLPVRSLPWVCTQSFHVPPVRARKEGLVLFIRRGHFPISLKVSTLPSGRASKKLQFKFSENRSA